MFMRSAVFDRIHLHERMEYSVPTPGDRERQRHCKVVRIDFETMSSRTLASQMFSAEKGGARRPEKSDFLLRSPLNPFEINSLKEKIDSIFRSAVL